MNVTLARFSALGDVAMTIPAIYDACLSHPSWQFTMLTKSFMTGIFINAPENLRVVGVDLAGRHKGPIGLWRLLRELRREGAADCFVDLHNVLRTRILGAFCFLHGIPVKRIDKGRADKRRLTRTKNKVMRRLPTSIDRYRRAIERAGCCLETRFNGLFYGAKADPALFSGITTPKRPSEKWIGIAPFARHNGKIYPLEMMAEIIDILSSRPATKLFIFGAGEKERDQIDKWIGERPHIINMAAAKAGFAAELALMNNLDVMLSMDSANMHLAAIAGAPTISIWGATHPSAGFTAWRQGPETVIGADLKCRPCSVFGDKPCRYGDYRCMRSISPQSIAARINNIITSNNP